MQTIAFIGLGHMGAPMALNLHQAGFAVQAFDLNAAAGDSVATQGVSVADSARSRRPPLARWLRLQQPAGWR